MTDENLEEKADEYTFMVVNDWSYETTKQAYIAGAKENGVVWHDLRKNANDLPPRLKAGGKELDLSVFVINQDLDQCYYDYRQKHWFTDDSDEMIAWCEIPKFKED